MLDSRGQPPVYVSTILNNLSLVIFQLVTFNEDDIVLSFLRSPNIPRSESSLELIKWNLIIFSSSPGPQIQYLLIVFQYILLLRMASNKLNILFVLDK